MGGDAGDVHNVLRGKKNSNQYLRKHSKRVSFQLPLKSRLCESNFNEQGCIQLIKSEFIMLNAGISI